MLMDFRAGSGSEAQTQDDELCEPFAWAKDADAILAKANRQTTSFAGH